MAILDSTNQPSRRQFLTALASVAPVAAAVLVGCTQLGSEQIDLDSAVDMPDPNIVLYTDGYGPAERAQAIRRWYFRFDVLIQLGEKMQAYLESAHVLPPSQVDGMGLLKLEWEVLEKLNDLTGEMETIEFDDDYKLITGARSYLWCLKHDILTGGDGLGMKPDAIQLEIDAIREDDPTVADELQALLNARMGVRNG